FQLDYPVIWFGPGHCAHESLLVSPRWTSSTKRGLAGIRIEAEVPEDAVFKLFTQSGNFTFSAKEIAEEGRIEFPVGPKYLGCHIIVTRTGYYWFLPPDQLGQTAFAADDLADSVPVHDWARMRTAWIAPEKSVKFTAELPEFSTDHAETILHIIGMAAPGYTPGAEKQVHDDFPMTLLCDGKTVAQSVRYYREHDTYMQLLEDEWLRFPTIPGKHKFELCNNNKKFYFLISRLILQQSEHLHLELSLPPWALAGEPLIGRVYAVREDSTIIRWPGGEKHLKLKPGWNDFAFSLVQPGINITLSTDSTSGTVPAVYALKDEMPEVTVGYDMTVVPHDDNGFMDWLLDYTWRTRLGNLVVFRNFRRTSSDSREYAEVPDYLLARWGKFCHEHRIYVEAATSFDSGALTQAAGKMLHSVGKHEWPGAVYAFDPGFEWRSEDMKSAMEHYLQRLKIEIDRAHKVSPRAAFGDASGGHRYCYMAGADFIRTETMVPHTQHICSQARPAAEALSDGEWGVHIAIQHPFQPYFENHLGQYFLSLFQPWMMGASMIYEEDCLFSLFKEERQAWDDFLTKGKRAMTRDFFRFVKTHPRQGAPTRKIAFVEGRYAAPFNGFICDTDQDPDYSVWGLFGKNDPLWGHRQPEKCRQLLDILMPGASTLPLRQDFSRRRFFFSGTPYGDFDEVPTEATAEYFDRYSLLLHLGWNTMIQEDYDKLSRFVENGGEILIGLPQFSKHLKRDFLADMMELDLWNGGDLSELCGVKVKEIGKPFSGQWNCADRHTYAEAVPGLSGIPSKLPEEDGDCRTAKLEFAGAEPLIWDAATGEALVIRFRKGKGTVYLITTYAYPGHEALREVISALMVRLAQRHLPQSKVEDPLQEVFWNEWIENNKVRRLMLLNTDWTTAGNEKAVTIENGTVRFETTVKEREAKILTVLPQIILEPSDPSLHLEVRHDGIICHGTGKYIIAVHKPNGKTEKLAVDLTEMPWTKIKLPE
ncbi:MAG: hypothetical protein WCT05_13675, partial [Lentisphaeria bacterium]